MYVNYALLKIYRLPSIWDGNEPCQKAITKEVVTEEFRHLYGRMIQPFMSAAITARANLLLPLAPALQFNHAIVYHLIDRP